MKPKLNILSYLLYTAVVLLVVASCGRDARKETDHSRLPREVKPVAMAIISDSPQQFASKMNYPIERPYPLRNIEDSAQMVGYYNTLVDDSLRNTVRETPDSLWQEDGWRGWTIVGNSCFWIEDGNVYAIDYVSHREKEMLDSLRDEEIQSLEPSMRHGWKPVLCIVDTVNGAIFRIDTDMHRQPPVYRLAGYKNDSDLSGQPTLMLYGTLTDEGTMENRFYHFADSIGDSADFTPDVVDDSEPQIEVVRGGQLKRYTVKPGYWLDHIHNAKVQQQELHESQVDPASEVKITTNISK